MNSILRLSIVTLGLGTLAIAHAEWKLADGPLSTRWTKLVSPSNALPEYPRPQMVRKQWLNLNGLWDFAMTDKDASKPDAFSEKILVPYPVESALSGVMKHVAPNQQIWYKKSFTIPADWKGKHIKLNFGAVDWKTTVFVNGKQVGVHTGGYDPFSFDITSALAETGEQEVTISVWDPTDSGSQPHGKQVLNPGGCMYTTITGIWQTVWLEPVAPTSIEFLRFSPDIDKGVLNLATAISKIQDGYKVEATVLDGARPIETAKQIASKPFVLSVPNAKLWSPEHPFLYNLKVVLRDAKGRVVDQVSSYFGMRKISLGKDENGHQRICLNNKPYFLAGPLDQGFWPDGLYTPPTDAAMKYDIEITKKLGFNFIRKHVKVEPARWYTWCDKLGIVVWQDMPSGDAGHDGASSNNFGGELAAMIHALYNSPSIVQWVVFNEGWGQHDTAKFVKIVRTLDPSRLIDNASGWTDQKVGDVIDAHVYPGPASPDPENRRAAVLGECGGLGLIFPDHAWQKRDNWGYQSYTDREKLTDAIIEIWKGTRMLISQKGLSAIVYTQTTDVETESNGFMTYDREVLKPDLNRVRAEVLKLYGPMVQLKTIEPTSQKSPITWQYTFDKPEESWMKPDYDSSQWMKGPAGFGTKITPGVVVRTEWKTSDIWIRREIVIKAGTVLNSPSLMMHHDEDAEVYIDGQLIVKAPGFTSSYGLFGIDRAGVKLLKPGKHTIAVHCHQTGGGQYIDLGIVDVK